MDITSINKTMTESFTLFCGGSENCGFQWLYKELLKNFLELHVRGRIYSFLYKFLIVIGNRSRTGTV